MQTDDTQMGRMFNLTINPKMQIKTARYLSGLSIWQIFKII